MFPKYESFVFEKVRKTRLPSVATAVVRGNDVVWSGAVGFRDLANGLAATPRSLYGIGSVTKSFTALAIMQLAEQGKLSVNDPVDRFLPFTICPQGEKVRLWHLLSHSSGIPGLAYAECFINNVTGADAGWLPISSVEDMLAFMKNAGEWAITKPGERWFYLNEGYYLLSAIIEKVSGQKFYDYIHDRIFAPLGMERSYFRKVEVEKDGELALPYLVMQDGERRLSAYPYGLTGDGGILSSVLDMAKYVGMYLGWGKAGSTGEQLVSKESIEEMQTPRVKTPPEGNPFGDYRYAYGLGVLENFLGRRLVGHSGSVGVSTAYMGFIPSENLGVVVLANGSGYTPSQLGQYALAEALGEDPDALPFVQREANLADLEGTYETYQGTTQMQVKAAGDFITLVQKSRLGVNTVMLIPEEQGKEVRKFYTLSGGTRLPVEFRLKDGKAELIYERYLLRRTGKLS